MSCPTVVRVLFHSEKEKWGELSNFFNLAEPLVFQDRLYSTSEHLYQARKFIYPGATDDCLSFAEEIRQASTPYKAKILAQRRPVKQYAWQIPLVAIMERYPGVTPNPLWEKEKIEVMREILFLKFRSDPHCRRVLFSTAGQVLVEHTSTDAFWGDGGDSGKGQNWLGRLLVQIREQLLLEEDLPTHE